MTFALFPVGCGYVGPPLPPALNIPATGDDLSLIEQGDKVIVQFTIPKLTTEGMVLRSLGPVELRVGLMTSLPFHMDEWVGQAKRIENLPGEPGPVKAVVPVGQWVNNEIAAAVRLSNSKGRLSDWSKIATLRLVPPLAAPAEFKAEAIRQGVRLIWRTLPGAGVNYRVYRAETLLATVPGNEYTDTTTKYGERYQYSVQAFQKSGDINAESEMSAPMEITPANKFPPAVPSGLRVVAGTDSIELQWDRNTEPDLRGYRVYRSANGGEWERLAEVDVPSYSDHAIKTGQQYRYALSSIDQAGNESERSAPVEIASP